MSKKIKILKEVVWFKDTVYEYKLNKGDVLSELYGDQRLESDGSFSISWSSMWLTLESKYFEIL